MLSGLLNSPLLASHTELARKLSQMEKKYDEQFKVVFDAIRALMEPAEKPRKKIGFDIKERRATYGKGTKKKKTIGGTLRVGIHREKRPKQRAVAEHKVKYGSNA